MACMVLTSASFKFTKAPLFSSLLLVLFSITSGGVITASGSGWVFMAMIIMFLGGMMVIFIYASSLNSSKKSIFEFSLKKSFLILGGVSSLLVLLGGDLIFKSSFTPASIYSGSNSMNLGFMALYLLLTLLFLVKIVRCGEGPLKTQLV